MTKLREMPKEEFKKLMDKQTREFEDKLHGLRFRSEPRCQCNCRHCPDRKC